jgi:hypothetical protein
VPSKVKKQEEQGGRWKMMQRRGSSSKVYGAYGSNMNVGQMSQRCPRAKVIGTGTLKDYRLTFRGVHHGVANVERKRGCSVPIVLWGDYR